MDDQALVQNAVALRRSPRLALQNDSDAVETMMDVDAESIIDAGGNEGNVDYEFNNADGDIEMDDDDDIEQPSNIENYMHLIRYGIVGYFPNNFAIIVLSVEKGVFIDEDFPTSVTVTTMIIDGQLCFDITDLASLAHFMGFEDEEDGATAVALLRRNMFRSRWVEHCTSDYFYENELQRLSACHQLPDTHTIVYSETVFPGMPEEMGEDGVPGVMDERHVPDGEPIPNETYKNNLPQIVYYITDLTDPNGDVVMKKSASAVYKFGLGVSARAVYGVCKRVYDRFVQTLQSADEDLPGTNWNILCKYEEE